MQTSVPDLMDLSKEPESVFELYGPESRKPGTYAANCLLARRLAERNVRFIQLYHRGWDQHKDLPRDMALQCKGTDQPTAALITDLKQRGLLDDTLVVWGGEFGRTVFSQGKLTDVNYGRDHHPRNFCMFVAGAGTKRGFVLGETGDFSYNIASDPVCWLNSSETFGCFVETQPTFRAGSPRVAIQPFNYDTGPATNGLDVSPDGQRFLVLNAGGKRAPNALTHLNVVLNWVEEVKQKVAGK